MVVTQILPTGAKASDSPERLSSPQMRGLLETLKSEADIVLVDCPPVLAASDAMVLATLVDGVVMVVDQARVSLGEIMKTRQAMDQVGAHFLGVVFSKLDPSQSDYHYYYYYSDYRKQA